MPAKRQTASAAKRKKTVKKKVVSSRVERDMRIVEILDTVPDAAEIFALHGLHCAGCQFQTSDTLEEGTALHGMNEEKLQDLIEDLRTGIPESMKRPKTITITNDAATGLVEALSMQGKKGWHLLVTTDEAGGFCMEFIEHIPKDHERFSNTSVPELIVAASAMTLASVGGSTIDMRDGRFKLDLPSAADCGCKKRE